MSRVFNHRTETEAQDTEQVPVNNHQSRMVCKHCGKPSYRRLNSTNMHIVCKECKESLYRECAICGEYFFKDYMNSRYCPHCRSIDPTISSCAICGNHKAHVRGHNGSSVCQDCYDLYPSCKGCDHKFHAPCGQEYCKSCTEYYGERNVGIMYKQWILEMAMETPIMGLGTIRLLEAWDMENFIGECECCSQNFPFFKWMYKKINGGYYCLSCAPDMVGCSNCTNVMVKGQDEIHRINGDNYCQSCYKEFPACDDCDDIITGESRTIRVSGSSRTVCESCLESYQKCDDCGDWVQDEDFVTFSNSSSSGVCQECYSDYYGTCESCGEVFHQDNMRWNEYDDCQYCRDCYRDRENEIFDNDPEYEVQYIDMEKDESFTIGMELEFECSNNRTEIAQHVYNNLYPLFWNKTDGSLSGDNGLETPCQPMTWEFFLNSGKETLQKYISFLNRRNCRAWRTDAGLHISLGRSGFSTGHLYKFLKFFYENPDYIFRISRRESYKFEKWCDCKTLDRKGLAKKFRENKDYNGDKYEAVNLNHSTHIEVRIFAGTLNWQSLMANIEFCRGLYEYTRDENIKDVSVNNFGNFMVENKDSFPCFYELFKPSYQHTLPCDSPIKIRKSCKRIAI